MFISYKCLICSRFGPRSQIVITLHYLLTAVSLTALVMATIHLLILFLLFHPDCHIRPQWVFVSAVIGVICRLESDIQEQIWVSMDWSQQLFRTSAQQCLNLMFWSFFYTCRLRTQLPELFEPRYKEDNIYLLDDSYVVGGTDTVHSEVEDTTGGTLPYTGNLALKYNTIL